MQTPYCVITCGHLFIIENTHQRLFSQMTELVMVMLFTPFSRCKVIKGDTKRHPPTITLNLPQNKFEMPVLTNDSPRGEVCESSYRLRM